MSRVKDSATAEVTNGFAGTKAAGQIVKSVETTFAISQGAQCGASLPLFYHSIKTHSGISLFSLDFYIRRDMFFVWDDLRVISTSEVFLRLQTFLTYSSRLHGEGRESLHKSNRPHVELAGALVKLV